jgi:tetratricopeptide (TPR) repeat protein
MRLTRRKSLMKKVLLLLPTILMASFFCFGQAEISASGEMVGVYHSINNFIAENQIAKAEKEFSKVIEFYKSSHSYQALPEQYFGMALALALNGHYSKSISYHKKALRAHRKFRDTEPYEITINLGLTYHLAGKKRKARAILGESYALVSAEKKK